MEFISTKNMTNETAPKGKVLVQYLESSFGGWNVNFEIGYYDNPNDYEDGDGGGWKRWHPECPINVLAYAELPETIKTELTKYKQLEFYDVFGSFHPNLGSVGEYNIVETNEKNP
jgi:hypothetical protein